jgi:YVTN family beta-propeller protein
MDDDVLQDFKRLNKNEKNNGVFIINEGNFMYSNSSLSYYNPETKEITNNIFYNTNALPLGDVAQSMSIKDSLAYIVINNSGKIYIINTNTFKYTGKITGLISPRHIFFINNSNKAYISDLYSKKISIYNYLTKSITGHINIDNGNNEFEQHNSEMFVQINNKVYVNSWSYDNTILVIDCITDKIIDSIKVGKQPNSMIIDKNNNLWVLSDGGFDGSSYGQENAKLCKINTTTDSISAIYKFNNINVSPSHLCTNNKKDSLFFIYNSWSGNLNNKGIYAMSIYDNEIPQTHLYL